MATQLSRASGTDGSEEGLLYGALWYPQAFATCCWAQSRGGGAFAGMPESSSDPTPGSSGIWGWSEPKLESSVSRCGQSNSSVIFGDRFILKLFRKMEPGVHPDIEIGTS